MKQYRWKQAAVLSICLLSLQLMSPIAQATSHITEVHYEFYREITREGKKEQIFQANPAKTLRSQKQSDDPHEDVIYDDKHEEVITLTEEQAKIYRQTGHLTYQPNFEKVSSYFLNYLKELRKLNEISLPVVGYSDAAKAYAQFRANELLTNPLEGAERPTPVLNHDTKDDRIRLQENALSFPVAFTTGTTWNQNNVILSDQQMAYYLLLSWYADYNNVSGRDYGHRLSLLFNSSDSQALAYASFQSEDYDTPTGSNKDNLYIYVTQTGIDDADSWLFETLYGTGEHYKSQVTYDKDNQVFFKGKRMTFLPDTTFIYRLPKVATTTE